MARVVVADPINAGVPRTGEPDAVLERLLLAGVFGCALRRPIWEHIEPSVTGWLSGGRGAVEARAAARAVLHDAGFGGAGDGGGGGDGVSDQEIGAAYEHGLSLAAIVNPDGAVSVSPRSGHRRKSSGSYYTPARLIGHLLDRALTPAIDEAVGSGRGENRGGASERLLSLRLCDPACGAGYFLLAAADRITDSLCVARHGPSATPADRSRAFADVAALCIHGVDIDPIAVEITRALLARRAGTDRDVEAAIRQNIRVGNALLGATPELIAAGIPDAAYADIDAGRSPDAGSAAGARKRNRTEKRRAWDLPAPRGRVAADVWCAAFLLPPGEAREWITERVVRLASAAPAAVHPRIFRRIVLAVMSNRVFHWHTEFPPVFDRERPGFDVIVGNPPFLNQLETQTAADRRVAAIIAARTGGVSRGYTDISASFLALAMSITRTGGRVSLVQPQSLLAAEDATAVRDAALRAGRLESLWVSNEHVFPGVNVYACAPTILIGPGTPATVERWAGADFRKLADAPREAVPQPGETWAPLAAVARGVPEISPRVAGVLGDLATATADFRDQYYGLDGFLLEDAALDEQARPDFDAYPAIVTTGLIDLAMAAWGTRPTRILKRRWDAPRLDRVAMDARGELGPWVRQRLVPKILLATQTRILEPMVDDEPRYLPCTPVITVCPRASGDLWRCAAVIASPVASAIAMRLYGGAALHVDAIKLSAKQTLMLPLPRDRGAWDTAAGAFRAAHRVEEGGGASRDAELARFGREMTRAYGVTGQEAQELLAWWEERRRARGRGGRRPRPGEVPVPAVVDANLRAGL